MTIKRITLALSLLICTAAAPAREIGFIEEFSLAEDRNEALKQLIPGTEDFYHYACLQAQNSGQTNTFHSVLDLWIHRYGYTAQVKEMMNRQALFDYKTNPRAALAYIRKELGLTFDHRRVLADQKTDFPSRLDPALIGTNALIKAAFMRYQNLQGIEDAGLEFLDAASLDPVRRRDLLNRLPRPDLPGLAQRVVDDLRAEHSGGFGAIPIHANLLYDQLLACASQMPELMNNVKFVEAVITKLAADNDVEIRFDPKEKRAYLNRLVGFTRRLAPAFNSLKTHALYQLLDLDRHEGRYDADLFMEYVKLPRNVAYISPAFANLGENRNVMADLNADFQAITRFPPIMIDEELVRDYLSHIFLVAPDYDAFTPYIREDYVRNVFVETKIVNGLGDMEKWYSLMSPEAYKALKERVDLDFAISNKMFFAADDPVSLDVHVKNVSTLIVKVFELNVFNYYRNKLEEFDPSLDLDGLIATDERTVKIDASPLHRMLRSYPFPQCAKPGVYVVEFIGNGRSSRVLIRKGFLHTVEKIGPAGHEFVIMDEANRRRPQAVVWLGEREYRADDAGVVRVPFSTQPGLVTMILKEGNLCSLASFRHRSEVYALHAGFYVDRESLLKGAKARLVIRPVLTLNGYPVSLSLLESVKLSMQSVDRQSISTLKEWPDFKLAEDGEAGSDFQVPENLARLRFTLTAKVRNISLQKDDELADQDEFALNEMDSTLAVEQILVREVAAGYVVDLLGKNGETKAGRPVHVELKHRAFRDPVHAALQTDANGRIELGALADIDWFKTQGPDGISRTWRTGRDEATVAANVHGLVGTVVTLPFFDSGEPAARQVALLEKRGSTFVINRVEAVRFRNGFLEIAGLPAGDYELFLKRTGQRVNLRLTAGALEAEHAVSRMRSLEVLNPAPLQIGSLVETGGTLSITLTNATPFTRVHVLATRFMPAYWVKGKLDYALPEPGLIRRALPESVYVGGRDIGDEYRYVLDRKYAEKFPGSMLARPGLLLAPWSINKTETGEQELSGMNEYGSASGGGGALRAYGGSMRERTSVAGDYANLDFLRDPAALLYNFRPDSNGVVTVARKALGDHAYIRVVAVDPFTTVCRHAALPETPAAVRDLRLPAALDAKKHFTEQKTVSVVPATGVLELKDITTSEVNLYDSLETVYNLLSTLSEDDTLAEFRFILRWPDLKQEEKKEHYSKHACHELNFFLYHKDRPFFDAVVLPFLKNKKDKTFLDRWLVGDDLSAWTRPWSFGQLNIVEQALLARRGAAPAGGLARYVSDKNDLITFDPDDYNRRFDTGIRSSVLETGDSLGLEEARKVEGERKSGQEIMILPKPVSAPRPSVMPEPARALERPVKKGAMKELLESSDMLVVSDAESDLKGDLAGKAKRQQGYFDARRKDRETQARFFRKLDKTEEWVENNYYQLPIEEQDAGLVTVNPFWTDYARHDGKTPFLSPNVFYAATNFTEVMLALAVIDLPFKAAAHTSGVQGVSFTLKAGSPLLAFHQEIKEGAPAAEKFPVLVSQNYFRADDRYRYSGNERFDKFVTEEFLAQTAYGCQVVLVNPTSSRQTLRLLLQIPQGSLPVQNGFRTRGLPVTLEPYATRTFDYYFYFPLPGQAPHYPVQVAKAEQFVAGAEPFLFAVVEKLSRLDTESWDYVSQHGSPEDVLAFLRGHNLNRLDLDKTAWRMKDKAYFEQVLALLQERHVYSDTLWSYGLYHDVIAAAREYLKHSDFANRCGPVIDTPLLSLDPVERKTYQHMEYNPLVNARAHQVGRKREILNDRFFDQYQRFLTVLSYRPELDSDDLLGATYYLLLQDRVGEALKFFRKIDPARIPAALQYDYIQVVMAFYRSDLALARKTVDRYRDYPVPRWRNLFAEARSQLDELEGKAAALTDVDDRLQAQTRAAATEPGLDFKVEARQITLHYQNLDACRIHYYPMDIELLFSRNPFVQQQGDQFAFVRPAESQEVALPAGQDRLVIDIPKRFYSSNVMVELVAGGLRRTAAYYAHSLAVQVIEPYGQVRVSGETTRKPLPGVYIKAYARMKDGTVRFYKDGYTDLRGRFDYASLNTNELDEVERFSLLVLSDEFGAVIHEAAPPKR